MGAADPSFGAGFGLGVVLGADCPSLTLGVEVVVEDAPTVTFGEGVGVTGEASPALLAGAVLSVATGLGDGFGEGAPVGVGALVVLLSEVGAVRVSGIGTDFHFRGSSTFRPASRMVRSEDQGYLLVRSGFLAMPVALIS